MSNAAGGDHGVGGGGREYVDDADAPAVVLIVNERPSDVGNMVNAVQNSYGAYCC